MAHSDAVNRPTSFVTGFHQWVDLGRNPCLAEFFDSAVINVSRKQSDFGNYVA